MQPEAACFNSYDFTHKIESTPCECDLRDTECEFGWEPRNGECVKITDVELNNCPVRSSFKRYLPHVGVLAAPEQ